MREKRKAGVNASRMPPSAGETQAEATFRGAEKPIKPITTSRRKAELAFGFFVATSVHNPNAMVTPHQSAPRMNGMEINTFQRAGLTSICATHGATYCFVFICTTPCD